MYRNSWVIRLIRPVGWIVFLFPVTVGFYLGASNDTSPVSIVCGFSTVLLVLCFGFSANALGDVDVDKHHNGRSKDMDLSFQPLVTAETSIKQVQLLCLVFLSGSLLCAAVVGFSFLLTIILLLAIGYVYSLEPFRMKKRPIWDILCNALLGVFFFLAGVTIGEMAVPFLLIIAVFLMASNFYIPTVMTDYEFDKKAGLRTSAVVYRGTRLINTMYVLTAALCVVSVVLVFSSTFQVQMIAAMMGIYTPLFTVVTKKRLQGTQLLLHKNWILLPFGCLSVVFFCLGLVNIIA